MAREAARQAGQRQSVKAARRRARASLSSWMDSHQQAPESALQVKEAPQDSQVFCFDCAGWLADAFIRGRDTKGGEGPPFRLPGLRQGTKSLGLRDVALDDFFDLLFGDGADDLVGYLAALENQQGGDAADIEFSGGVLVVVHVELDDLELAGVFAGDFLDGGREHVTRAAPVGPEIDHDGLVLARVDDFRLKIRVADCLKSAFCHLVSVLNAQMRGLPAGGLVAISRYFLDVPAALGILDRLAASYSVT